METEESVRPEVTRVEIHRLCAMIKQRVSVALLEAVSAEDKSEILIGALYEMSRSVLPLLGSPGRSRQYLERQGSVLDLISFLAIPLLRGAAQERHAVAVLSEIGEGCQDPLLRKKLSVYAHELLAKANGRQIPRSAPKAASWPLLLAPLVAALALYSAWPVALHHADPSGERPATAAAGPATLPLNRQADFAPASGEGAGGAVPWGGRGDSAASQAEAPAAQSLPAVAQEEKTTRVRIVNNQVLVPVTLKNGGEAVLLELVLDTGACRTVIHDVVAGRLQIDLRQTQASSSEVADGRVIHSRIARIDSLAVGPFSLAPVELELIAYSGADGRRDGLLGMDFLGKHRYQIDMERELIRWF